MREIGKSYKKSFSFLRIFALTIFFLIITVGFVKFLNLEKYLIGGPKTVVNLITDSGIKSDNGRTNFLLLGTGGLGHQGPDLTDTIMLASVASNGKDVVLVSIPRDLWAVNISAKVNSAYAFGREKEEELKLVKETVEEITGLPVHYALRVDFAGFVKAVDLVDGVDVIVETSFVDTKYPVAGKENDLCGLMIETVEADGVSQEVVKDATGAAIPISAIDDENNPFLCRYETIAFDSGQTYMDGETALKFVRSRHGTNVQGSDFARSARQQKVILAFREKVFSTETLLNPAKIIELVKTFGDSIDTDVDENDVPLFLKLAQKTNTQSIRRVVLDQGRDESVLASGNPGDYGGQFVLVPKDGSWTDLAEYIQGEVFKLETK